MYRRSFYRSGTQGRCDCGVRMPLGRACDPWADNRALFSWEGAVRIRLHQLELDFFNLMRKFFVFEQAAIESFAIVR